MPPHVPQKRRSTETPTKRTSNFPKKAKRESLFDAVEARAAPPQISDQEKFLSQLDGNDSETSSLSEAQSFSAGPGDDTSSIKGSDSAKRQQKRTSTDEIDGVESSSGGEEDEDEDEEDHQEWDSFLAEHDELGAPKPVKQGKDDERMQITVEEVKDVRRSDIKLGDEKKGPSKIDRQIRNTTHQLHVMSLIYHNHIRNCWINNEKVQDALVKQLTGTCKDELERWRAACKEVFGKEGRKEVDGPDSKRAESDGKNKSKRKGRPSKDTKTSQSIRDWGPNADEDKDGNESTSQADPTLRLVKALCTFWRKRFTKTAPGLRKQGYKSIERIQDELKLLRKEPNGLDEFGERIDSLEDFISHAKRAKGSRDAGAQLFTALLRGVGLNARLVASLQPAGFGWSKLEEADPPKKQGRPEDKSPHKESKPAKPLRKSVARPKLGAPAEHNTDKPQPGRRAKSSTQGNKSEPINLSDSDESPLSDPPSSGSESVVDITTNKLPTQSHKRYDGDLRYPHYWTEVLSPITNTYIPVDPICLSVVASNLDSHAVFEPQGGGASRNRQVMAYVIAFNHDGSAKDVTTRYLKRHVWPGKTKGVRYPIEKVPIHNRKGKIIRHEQYDWFKDVMSLYQPQGGFNSDADNLEDSRELKPVYINRNNTDKPPQESLQYYKNSADFVLECHLRREEALLPSAQPVKFFTVGKGEKASDEPVFKRNEVVACKSSESWHKEGRQVKVGEQPLKRVPMRAVTASRKAEIEQTERETGVKAQQALFSKEQTEWIIPPPIEDGVIPKNAFGNIDVYVPTMVPEGASHVALRGTAKVCKKLGIDFAEACTGFEFGNKIAVPVLTGVVVAAENKRMVIDAWREEERIRREKERKKQEKLALGMWRKMLAGLRVIERVRAEYGIVDERKLHKEMEQVDKPNRRKGGKNKSKQDMIDLSQEDVAHPHEPRTGFPEAADNLGGGFLAEGMDAEIIDRKPPEQKDHDSHAGGFIIEEEDGDPVAEANSVKSDVKSITSLRQQAAQAEEERSECVDDEDANEDEQMDGVEWTASQNGVLEAKPKAANSIRGHPPSKPQSAQKATDASSKSKKRGRPKKKSPSPLTEEEQSPEDNGLEEKSELSNSNESDDYAAAPKKKRPGRPKAATSSGVGQAGRRKSRRLN
ncbi:MAG: hypothetical protein Q9162_002443 [Coniocarpon cinnabarinum]